MTNEEFKGIYDSYLSHAWVTSKDATKAAEQKKKQQEYNRKYYQNNKDKWNSGADRDYDKAKKEYDKAKKEYDNFERIINETANGPMTDARRRALEFQSLAVDRLSSAKEAMDKAHQKQLDVAKLRSERIKKSSNEKRGYEQAVANRRKSAGETIKNRDDQIKKSSNESRAYSDAVKQRKLAQDRKNARKSPFQMGFRELSTENVRSRSHSDNASRAEQNARSTTYSNRRLKNGTIQKKIDKIRNNRTKVNDFTKNRAANEAAAYSVSRSLARQTRLQKSGKSSYPSKTTPRNKKNKGPK